MRAQSDTRIERIVKETLSDDFEDQKILEIYACPDQDADGNDVLRIDVIFEGAAQDVNAGRLAGAVRQVRPRLREIGENAFPLFSFISSKDRDVGFGCA